MERCAGKREYERGHAKPVVTAKFVRAEYDAGRGVEPMDAAVVDYEALKQNPVVDCAAFKELHRTEEFKNLLNFLDTIEIDDDGNSFSYINPSSQNASKEIKKETTEFETDGIFTRRRSYSKQNSLNNFHSSDYLHSDSIFEEPNAINTCISPGPKQLPQVIPPTDPKILEYIARGSDKIITIDGIQRVLRFYNENTITFINANDPREVKFEGVSVNIIIDDIYSYSCFFNKPNVGFILDNQFHTMRLGTPTRELYIDDNFFACSFNGPPFQCVLNNVRRSIKIVGHPPAVVMGNTIRQDLVAGISHIIVDDFHPVVIYLDAKPQCIDVGQSTLVLRFVNNFKSVLINNQNFTVDFDGEPLEIDVQGHLHSLKFTKLPPYIQPGFTSVFGMFRITPTEYTTNSSSVPHGPTKNKNTSKSHIDVQEYSENNDLSTDSLSEKSENSMDSLITLKAQQSNLHRQLKEIESDQMSSIIPSPTISTNSNTNIINELSNKIENKEYQFDINPLYDPWDTKLEITYCKNFTFKKSKTTSQETDIMEESIENNEKSTVSIEKKSMSLYSNSIYSFSI